MGKGGLGAVLGVRRMEEGAAVGASLQVAFCKSEEILVLNALKRHVKVNWSTQIWAYKLYRRSIVWLASVTRLYNILHPPLEAWRYTADPNQHHQHLQPDLIFISNPPTHAVPKLEISLLTLQQTARLTRPKLCVIETRLQRLKICGGYLHE